MSPVTRSRGAAKSDAARLHEKLGFPLVPAPPGFGTVVAEDNRRRRRHPRDLVMVRPTPPVELEVERMAGVRRTLVPGCVLSTLVRQRSAYVQERQIVSLPADWRLFGPDRLRALWERATAVRHLSDDDVGDACSGADRYMLAFDVPKPFVVLYKGTPHVYYRTAENVGTNNLLYEVEVIEKLYSEMSLLNDRHVEKLLAESATDALVKEAGR